METFTNAIQETMREMGKQFVEAVVLLQGGDSEAEVDEMDSK